VRRSSEISFLDLDSESDGVTPTDFPIPNASVHEQQQRGYNGRPDMITFIEEWTHASRFWFGERGIFTSRQLAEACKRRMAAKCGMSWEEFRSVPPHQSLW